MQYHENPSKGNIRIPNEAGPAPVAGRKHRRRLAFISGAIMLTMLIANACDSNDVAGPGLPDENISFSEHVSPILQNNCVECHGGNGESGINLSSYSSLMDSFSQQYNSPVVVAGNAADSPLYDKINPSPQNGARMPQGRSPLSQEEIEAIGTWINEGAEDN